MVSFIGGFGQMDFGRQSCYFTWMAFLSHVTMICLLFASLTLTAAAGETHKLFRVQLYLETDGAVLEFPATDLTPGRSRKISARHAKEDVRAEFGAKLTEPTKPIDPLTLDLEMDLFASGMDLKQNLPPISIHKGETQEVVLAGGKFVRIKARLLTEESVPMVKPKPEPVQSSESLAVPVTDLRPKNL